MAAQEIRQAIRSVWRAPLFASVVVLLLALGIGSNALIFTAVETLLLRPLPVAHPEQIVRLGIRRSPTHTSYEHPYVYARVLREGAHAFSDVFERTSASPWAWADNRGKPRPAIAVAPAHDSSTASVSVRRRMLHREAPSPF